MQGVRGAMVVENSRVTREDAPQATPKGGYGVAVARNPFRVGPPPESTAAVAARDDEHDGDPADNHTENNVGAKASWPHEQTMRLHITSKSRKVYIGVVRRNYLSATDDDGLAPRRVKKGTTNRLYYTPDTVNAGGFAYTPSGWAYYGATGQLRHWEGTGASATADVTSASGEALRAMPEGVDCVEVVLRLEWAPTGCNLRMRVGQHDTGVLFRWLPHEPLYVAVALRDPGDSVEFIDIVPQAVRFAHLVP